MMERLIRAFSNSVRAFKRLAGTEKAFQQELTLLAVSLPAGWFIALTWQGYALLVGAVVFVMLVEILNTAVEAACDAVGTEFNENIQLAKDCGSLAVLIAIAMAAVVWALAIGSRIAGG